MAFETRAPLHAAPHVATTTHPAAHATATTTHATTATHNNLQDKFIKEQTIVSRERASPTEDALRRKPKTMFYVMSNSKRGLCADLGCPMRDFSMMTATLQFCNCV